MTSPLFERKTVFNSVQEPLSYDLDRSIEDALIGQKWFANPDRVRFFSYEDNGLVHLKNTLVPYLASGDVVWFSFTMQYVVNNVSWGPDLQLVDVVRVGRFEGKVEHPVGIRRGLQAGLITPISDGKFFALSCILNVNWLWFYCVQQEKNIIGLALKMMYL